jgi:hypothetical protein
VNVVLQTNGKVLKLTTHIVTPVFAKLNLLGLLHIVHSTGKAIPIKINPVGDIYELHVYSSQGFEEEFVKTLISIAKQMLRSSEPQDEEKAKRKQKKRKQEMTGRKRIVIEWFEVDQRYLYSGSAATALLNSIENLISASNYSYSDLIELLMKATRHDMRSGGKSPTLLLAPDLGKYSTAQIPYDSKYPNIVDKKLNRKEDLYLCTAISLIGLHAGFKLRVIAKNFDDVYIAIPSPRKQLSGLRTSMLYWIGRRLSFLSQKIGAISTLKREGRFSLSMPGLYAVLSPVIKDCVTSSSMLSAFEVVIYRITLEKGRGGGQYVRDFVSMGLDRVELLPDGISSVLLANINRLRDLIINVPEFFKLLGEYMLSGDDTMYVESLRVLASALHDRDISNNVKAVIREVLEHGTR